MHSYDHFQPFTISQMPHGIFGPAASRRAKRGSQNRGTCSDMTLRSRRPTWPTRNSRVCSPERGFSPRIVNHMLRPPTTTWDGADDARGGQVKEGRIRCANRRFTCQKMVSIVFPRKPSLVSDDSSLGPRMVMNSLKSTWPSPDTTKTVKEEKKRC